jgi:hypothetical protein
MLSPYTVSICSSARSFFSPSAPPLLISSRRRNVDGSSLLAVGPEVGSTRFEPSTHALPCCLLISSLRCSLGKGGKKGKYKEGVGKIHFYSGEE